MIKISILTLFPELFPPILAHSILGRGINKAIAEVEVINLRTYSKNKHKKVDDYPYGGGSGMVMAAQPLADAIRALSKTQTFDEIIFLTPDGEKLDQQLVNQLSLNKNILLICGHYKGIDQRIRDTFVTKEISIGDYVLSGGELAAAVLTDAIVRILPGVIGNESSALTDSFQNQLLDAPCYTRPENWEGQKVPAELLTGDPVVVGTWRHEASLAKTRKRRPDLLK